MDGLLIVADYTEGNKTLKMFRFLQLLFVSLIDQPKGGKHKDEGSDPLPVERDLQSSEPAEMVDQHPGTELADNGGNVGGDHTDFRNSENGQEQVADSEPYSAQLPRWEPPEFS